MKRCLSAMTAVVLLAVGGVAEGASLTALPPAGVNTGGNATTSAPDFGNGSWQESGASKAEYYVTPSALFGHAVAISEIESISWWTNKPAVALNQTPVDWYLALYTDTLGSGDSASWYHSRLNSEPYFSQGAYTGDTWKEWSTDGANPLRFFDQPRTGTYGTYTDPTLADLQSNPIDWPSFSSVYAGDPTVDYRNESIKYFSLQTGSDWSSGFTGLLDGLTVTLKNGEVGSVNFEAVPLPAAAWTGMALLVALAGVQSLKRLRRQEA